jgi:hypothetical protein
MSEPATIDYMIRQYINPLEFFREPPLRTFKDYLVTGKTQKNRRFMKSQGAPRHAGLEI